MWWHNICTRTKCLWILPTVLNRFSVDVPPGLRVEPYRPLYSCDSFIPTTCYPALCWDERRWLLSSRLWRFVFCYKMIEVSERAADPCLWQCIIIIPPWSWLCQVILKRPISASLNALHPWRWQAIFMWSSYLKTGRCSVPRNLLHLFLAQINSWAYKMELWSLAALSTCV